jgi:hypothetical protein
MRHFWLNEGWTTYFERLLLLALHSPAERDFSYIIGRNSLSKAVAEMAKEPRYQRLVIPFRFGEDPDDGYSTIPYEKGSNFLLYLGRGMTIPHLNVVDLFPLHRTSSWWFGRLPPVRERLRPDIQRQIDQNRGLESAFVCLLPEIRGRRED